MECRRLLPGCLLLALAACVTPKFNYQATSVDISEPQIGTTATVRIGDPLLRQGMYREHDAIRLSESVRVGTIGTYTFTPGHYLKQGNDKNGAYYRPGNDPGSGTVDVGPLVDPFQSIFVPASGRALCGVTTRGQKICKEDVHLATVKVPVVTEEAFQRTLIYSGKSGNRIRIAYRESSGNVARPPFNNDVEYDLSESVLISYRNVRFEVIEATNQQITYRLISNFD